MKSKESISILSVAVLYCRNNRILALNLVTLLSFSLFSYLLQRTFFYCFIVGYETKEIKKLKLKLYCKKNCCFSRHNNKNSIKLFLFLFCPFLWFYCFPHSTIIHQPENFKIFAPMLVSKSLIFDIKEVFVILNYFSIEKQKFIWKYLKKKSSSSFLH